MTTPSSWFASADARSAPEGRAKRVNSAPAPVLRKLLTGHQGNAELTAKGCHAPRAGFALFSPQCPLQFAKQVFFLSIYLYFYILSFPWVRHFFYTQTK